MKAKKVFSFGKICKGGWGVLPNYSKKIYEEKILCFGKREGVSSIPKGFSHNLNSPLLCRQGPLVAILTTRWLHLHWLQHLAGTIWIGSKFGHQVVPFAKLATRLRNLDCHIAFWITLLAFGIISKGRVPKHCQRHNGPRN